MRYVYFVAYCVSDPKSGGFKFGSSQATTDKVINSVQQLREIEDDMVKYREPRVVDINIINFQLLRTEE